MYPESVYIVENDSRIQQCLTAALKAHGFRVVVFNSGYPVVALMDNWPDVFLIDIQLPGINGLEVCKWLKSHEASAHIPVILLSNDPYLRILAASSRADDYVEKPFKAKEIIARIHDCLQAVKSTG